MLFFIVGFFIVSIIIGYINIRQQIILNHLKEETILFANIKNLSSDLLNKILYDFSLQKNILTTKHIIAKAYLDKNGVNINLSNLHNKLNENEPRKPYNIYITDNNFKIVNTTYSPDIGFDLSFAKNLFNTHKMQNIIGVSAPIFEMYSQKFNSYSDSYLEYPNDKKILQISYTYDNKSINSMKAIQAIIDKNPHIKTSKAYILFEDGYIGDFIFKSFTPHKPTLKEIEKRIGEGKEIASKLKLNEIVYAYLDDGQSKNVYKAIYIANQSPIFDNAKIVYEIVFDENDYNQKLIFLNIGFVLLLVCGMIGLYAITKFRIKELMLKQNKKFVRHAIHEIKTPLSIISINNQLRNKKYGSDNYSQDIESAIKILSNSYEDMSFTVANGNLKYELENIDLKSFIGNRIDYFNQIAISYGKIIKFISNDSCIIQISHQELQRLIDNNLSNAIKYSNNNSEIYVILEANELIFKTTGSRIIDKNKIFKTYYRECNVNGGLGIGLSIVYDICKKYNITIEVESGNFNIFKYKFLCEAKKDK